jgi:hypothetical protein
MSKKKTINYKETFTFPDIPVLYPVYALSESGKVMNFKSISYPTPRSKKKFTRNKQLSQRSMQAKIFDAFINVGYFDPLIVYREFPVVIQNALRLPGQSGMYYYLDYYFPELHLAVELDSDLHNPEKDKLRDLYLNKLGITVFRIQDLQKPNIQKTKFKELTALMRKIGKKNPIQFDFCKDIFQYALTSQKP